MLLNRKTKLKVAQVVLWLQAHLESVRFIQSLLSVCLLGTTFPSLIFNYYHLFSYQSWLKGGCEILLLFLGLNGVYYVLILMLWGLNTAIPVNNKTSFIRQLIFLIILSGLTFYSAVSIIYGKPNSVLFSLPFLLIIFTCFIIYFLLSVSDSIEKKKNFSCAKFLSFLLFCFVCVFGFCALVFMSYSLSFLLSLLVLVIH